MGRKSGVITDKEKLQISSLELEVEVQYVDVYIERWRKIIKKNCMCLQGFKGHSIPIKLCNMQSGMRCVKECIKSSNYVNYLLKKG